MSATLPIRWHGEPGHRFCILHDHTISERADGTWDILIQIEGDEVRIGTLPTANDAIRFVHTQTNA